MKYAILVKFAGNLVWSAEGGWSAGAVAVEATEKRHNIKHIKRLRCGAHKLVAETDRPVAVVLHDLLATGAVEYAVEDKLQKPQYVPNDPRLAEQWHLAKIGAPAAWDVEMGDGVVVAVCDTGIEAEHPDFMGNVQLPGYNAVDDSSDISPIHFHGTAVAGVVAAFGDNKIGVVGVAYGSRILPVKITNRADTGAWTSDLAEGICWAADHGAKVVNVSYSGCEDPVIDEAARYIRAKGSLLIMAGGNYGRYLDLPNYPSFLRVAATDWQDNHASFSAWGPYISCAAPGVAILTTDLNGAYAAYSGTSFAAPVVSGIAALLWSANPALTPANIESLILGGCKDLGAAGRDDYFGYGRVDAEASIARANTPIHDLAISLDAPEFYVVGQSGISASITVSNLGAVSEVARLVVRLGSASLELPLIALLPGEIQTLSCPLDAASLTPGSYDLVATADTVLGEVFVANNTARCPIRILAEAPKLWVNEIQWGTWRSGNQASATAYVLALSDLNPAWPRIGGVTVQATWGGAKGKVETLMAVTDGNGYAVFASLPKTGKASFTIKVLGMERESFVYAPERNIVSESSIMVPR